jgi:hypothetical protein
MPYMYLKVQMQHFKLILLPLCTKYQMGYTSCKADPNLWLQAVARPEDNMRYYTCILCYVDDILYIHHDPMSVMNEINSYLPLKPSFVGDPDIHLGAKLKLT